MPEVLTAGVDGGAREPLVLSCLALAFSVLAVVIVVWTAFWRTKGGRRLYRTTSARLEMAADQVRFNLQAAQNFIAQSRDSLGDSETDAEVQERLSTLKKSRQEELDLRDELDRVKAEYPGVEAIEWLSSPCRAARAWKRRRSAQRRRDELSDVNALVSAIDDLVEGKEEAEVLWRRAYLQLDSQRVRDPLKYGDISVHLPEKWGDMTVSRGDFTVSAGLVLRPFS